MAPKTERMRRRTYLRTTGALSIGALTNVAGCVGMGGGSKWDPTIGLAAPTSGPLGVLGGPIIEGGKVAIDEVNENSDRDIQWETGDTEGSPEAGLSAARDLQDQGVIALSNIVVSDVGLAVHEWAENEKFPCMGSFAGNTEITGEGTDYFFRFHSNNKQSTAGVVQFLNQEDISDIAIISLNDSYGRTVIKSAKTYTEKVGINVHNAFALPPGTTNFRPELNKIDNDAIQAIFIPYHGKGMVSLTEQLHETDLWEDNLIIGDDTWGAISIYKQPAGAAAVGLRFRGVNLTSQESQNVRQRISDRFGGISGVYRIIGYDTAKITAQAVANADEVTPQAVRDELANTDYQAVSGWQVKFNETGDNNAWRQLICKWVKSGDDIKTSAPFFKSDPIPGDDPGSILD